MYIRTFELEELLKNYNAIEALARELEIEYKMVANESESESDIIESMTFIRKLDGLPPGKGTITDRTSKAAISAKAEGMEDLKKICSDAILVSVIIEKLMIVMRSHRTLDKRIVELRLYDELTWDEVSKAVDCSTRTAQHRFKAAITRTAAISRIEMDDYLRVKKLIEGM